MKRQMEESGRLIQRLAERLADDPDEFGAMPPHVRAQLVASGFLGDSAGAS